MAHTTEHLDRIQKQIADLERDNFKLANQRDYNRRRADLQKTVIDRAYAERDAANQRHAAALEAVARARDDAWCKGRDAAASAAYLASPLKMAHLNAIGALNPPALRAPPCDKQSADGSQQDGLMRASVAQAANLLADAVSRRGLPFYIVDMALTENGDGPATIGIDAVSIQYEVWDAATFNTVSKHTFLSDAIFAMLDAIAGSEA